MFAHHNNNPVPRRTFKSSFDTEHSRFESYHSELQQLLDIKTIAAFNAGCLLVQDNVTRDLVVPRRVFIPSLTQLADYVDPETGNRVVEIQGGWLIRDTAGNQMQDDVPVQSQPDYTVAA